LILPDVNVLIYAFRSDSAGHADYKNWLDFIVNGDEAYGIAPQVLSSLVRICTHSRIYKQPSEVGEALSFCNSLLEAPNATAITPQERHWSIFQTLCTRSKATGNLVPDAWLAALAIESGCEWITTDGDFGRFEELNWRRPFP
jgi:toxin-antitoxin system PIN domain toxin